MRTTEDLIGKHKGREILIVCAGSTVKKYNHKIKEYIKKYNPIIFGINNTTDYFIPNYHLYTNTKRFRNFGHKIHKKSQILLSYGLNLKLIKDTIGSREYTLINFTDMKEGVPIGYRKGKIFGFYRTAGNLSIMISHLMGSSNITIVGMDGHTLYNYEDVKSGKKSHHCYDEKYVPFPLDICKKKDGITKGVLQSLKNYGVQFRILTPTVYKNFYDGTILGEL